MKRCHNFKIKQQQQQPQQWEMLNKYLFFLLSEKNFYATEFFSLPPRRTIYRSFTVVLYHNTDLNVLPFTHEALQGTIYQGVEN